MDFWDMTINDALSGTTSTTSAEKVLEEYASSRFAPSIPDLPEPSSVHQSAGGVYTATVNENPATTTVSKRDKRGNRASNGNRNSIGSRNSTKDQSVSLNRAFFDVKKLVISGAEGKEKEEAKARLAISLGAKPKKGKYVNYKSLKEERDNAKKVAEEQRTVKRGKVSKRKAKGNNKKSKSKKAKRR